MEAFLTHSKG